MAQKPAVKTALAFMVLGAVSALVVLGAVWLGYRLTVPKAGPSTSPAAVAADLSAVASPAAAAPDLVHAAAGAKTPAAAAAKSELRDSAAQPVPDTTPGAAAEAPPAPGPETLSPEQAEKEYQRELDYMDRKFDEYKPQLMGIIDTYLALPPEARADYLRQALEDLRQAYEADRAAAGMPARPAQRRRLGGDMLRMMSQKLSDDEKTKVMTVFADVAQSEMARVQARMRQQLNAPPAEPPPPGEPAPPEGGN